MNLKISTSTLKKSIGYNSSMEITAYFKNLCYTLLQTKQSLLALRNSQRMQWHTNQISYWSYVMPFPKE